MDQKRSELGLVQGKSNQDGKERELVKEVVNPSSA